MRTIILDLEWTKTCENGQHPRNVRGDVLCNEVIQIGAVAIDEEDGSIGETFLMDVSPFASKKVEKDITRLTGLTYLGLKKTGSRFKRAFETFQKFMEDENDSVRILTWDECDQQVLEENMRFWNLKYKQIPVYIDLQSVCGEYLFPGDDRKSVKNSLKFLKMKPYGSLHNALDDAINEARIFSKVPDAMEKLQTYNPFYFLCGMVSNPKALVIYQNISPDFIGKLLKQEVISSIDEAEQGEEIFPRFLHNNRYVKVFKATSGYVVEYTKFSKEKGILISYIEDLEEEELEKIKNRYATYNAKKQKMINKLWVNSGVEK